MDRDTVFASFSAIQKNVDLKEGINGLVKLFAAIDRFPYSSTQKLSQETGFPIPVCVAIRNEIEKLGWCKREDKGTIMTALGKEVISSISILNENFSCPNCTKPGLLFPLEAYKEQLSILEKYSDLRGKPNTVIDQSFATSKTSILRVLTMGNNYDLFYGNYALIGDSDLTCISLTLFLHPSSRIVVFDIDPKLREIINLVNKELNCKIEFVEHDLRKNIPEEFQNKFDCFLTDPPYTVDGVKLFVSRGIQMLSSKRNGTFYLSFGTKPPDDLLAIQKDLTDMGCLLTDILPRFNEYIGAQKLGGVSTFYRFHVSSSAQPLILGNYEGRLYTGDMNPLVRTYICTKCKREFLVGKNQDFITIELLKEHGCSHCDNNKFQKIREKKME